MTTVETNWDEIPAEYQYTAVNMDGEKRAYVGRPYIYETYWVGYGERDTFVARVGLTTSWRKSLRERPSAIPNKIQALVSANHELRGAIARLQDAVICFEEAKEPALAAFTKLIIKDIRGKLCGGGND